MQVSKRLIRALASKPAGSAYVHIINFVNLIGQNKTGGKSS